MARRRANWKEKTKVTSDVKDKKLNILLWGQPGTGKTHFIGTAPKPFIIASEDGVLTLKDQTIPYYLLNSDEEIYNTVFSILKTAKKKEPPFDKVETIALDSVWKLNKLLLDEILESSGTEKPSFNHWGLLRTRMSKLIEMLLSLDYHFIATVGERIKVDELSDDEEVKPVFNFSGGYASQIAYEFDFEFYLTVKTKGQRIEYLAHPVALNKYQAKSRLKFPKEILNPTFDLINSKVQEELKIR